MENKQSITLVNIIFPTRLGAEVYYYVPVGILSLSACLEKENIGVQILDYQMEKSHDPYNPRSILGFLEKCASPVLGVGLMAKDLPHTLLALKAFKERHPEKIIILGGPGATGSAEALMKRFSFIDYVVLGEGEVTLAELIKSLETGSDPSLIKGIVFRRDNEVLSTAKRERITDLDALPLPAYHLIEKEKYNYIYLPGARGCSHFCTFCDQPALWQGCEIKRSVKNLVGEIDYIKNQLKASWGVAFSDNEFCHDLKRFDEFAEELNKRSYHLPFSMDRRIDAVDDESLIKARNVGCHSILYGIESGSDRVLKEIRKDFNADKISPGLLLSAKHITSSVASFIFNYPFEELEDFLKTVNIIYPLFYTATENHVIFQLHYLAPLPRTPIFARFKERLIRRNVSNLMTSKDNMATYHIISNDKTGKILVLPKFDEDPTDQPREIRELVESDPLLFPSHYVYDSPRLDIKEKVIKSLRAATESRLRNMLFKYDDIFVYLGEKSVTVAGDPQDPQIPAVFTRLKPEELSREETMRRFLEYPHKTHIISIDLQEADPETGKAILGLMRKLRDHKISSIFITYVPEEFASFIVRLRLAKEFGMPGEPHMGGDYVYADENGIIRTFDGRTGAPVSFYRSKKILYRHVFEEGLSGPSPLA